MSLTIGLTGMDPATEAALKAAFVEANAQLGGRWALVPDAEARHVVVDMDSMYGPMSWLRLHAAGRQVIGLTSAPRTQTDFRLGRPFDVAQLVALLADVARGAGIELQAPAEATKQEAPSPVAPPAPPAPEPAAPPHPIAASLMEPPAPPAPAAPAPAPEAPPAAVAAGAMKAEPAAPAAAPATTTTTNNAAAVVEPPAPPAAKTATVSGPAGEDLATWLRPGAITGRIRFTRGGDAPVLLIDAAADAWHGPASLKPIAACFEGRVDSAALEAVDDATWFRETALAGPSQPLSRLRWLGGLLAGGGRLLPGLDEGDRFQLNKWPQTEREYPRHFRIATQMMKGPATLAEIAEASGVPASDVADFINANLATGFAEPAVETPVAAEEPAKGRSGLLGRLRSR